MAGHEAFAPIRFLSPSEAPTPGPSDLLTQFRQVHNAQGLSPREARRLKIIAFLNALEAGKRKEPERGVHLILSRPPEKEANFTVFAAFREDNGDAGFVQASRNLLGIICNPTYAAFLASFVRDVREETLSGRLQREFVEVQHLDHVIAKNAVREGNGIATDRHLIEEKNDAVHSYLRTALTLEDANPHLSFLFDARVEGADIALLMGEAEEENILQRLHDKTVKPVLHDGSAEHLTRLRRADLLSKTGFEIYDMLNLSPFTVVEG